MAESLAEVTKECLVAHHGIKSFVDKEDLSRYHGIYDLPQQDFQEVTVHGTIATMEESVLLRHLRVAMKRLFVVRQILLCDVLAIPGNSRNAAPDWHVISQHIRNVSQVLRSSTSAIKDVLASEEGRQWGGGVPAQMSPVDTHGGSTDSAHPMTPSKAHARAQMRRLDSMSQGVRTLHAKMHVLRDETDALLDVADDGTELSTALSRQYDTIGSELRSLLSEWEQGRNTMLLNAESHHRFSRSSSGHRSPMSPVLSLGGRTAVEGGPVDALSALTGEDSCMNSMEHLISDEEIFEAISLPRKRMSMTREEKVAKMREDRRKRATFQERTDTKTHMLRELETVIKHRPRGRTESRMTSI